jgi:hypothetical protein
MDVGDLHPVRELVPIANQYLEGHGRVDSAEDLPRDLDSAEDALGLREHHRVGSAIRRDGGEGGDIAGADVLGEGEVDDRADIRLE